MINIIKQEIIIDEALKRKLEFFCEFNHTTPTFINGSIRKVDNKNKEYNKTNKLLFTLKNVDIELKNNKILAEENKALKIKNNALASELENKNKENVLKEIKKYSDEGLRVIMVVEEVGLYEKSNIVIGFILLKDEIRKEVKKAVKTVKDE